ncbi:unnamed protein product [Caenorhabditis bovis]|uniref:Uncharacterized protein n=1 Tax=Caenorhabditis bovis TaxID=2654633 RepID=A0A8S1FF52_9PELO|nr:unnamed protein product [Caenorhabditis bovis]
MEQQQRINQNCADLWNHIYMHLPRIRNIFEELKNEDEQIYNDYRLRLSLLEEEYDKCTTQRHNHDTVILWSKQIVDFYFLLRRKRIDRIISGSSFPVQIQHDRNVNSIRNDELTEYLNRHIARFAESQRNIHRNGHIDAIQNGALNEDPNRALNGDPNRVLNGDPNGDFNGRHDEHRNDQINGPENGNDDEHDNNDM